jgi:GrpB-like predicted nucleotidyltransferase (UPF0157 family)
VVAGVEDDAAMESATPLIEGLYFREIDSPDWTTGVRQLIKPRHSSPEATEPTHRVLLMVKNTREWNRVLRLRDWLRDHPETAIRFEESKIARWRRGEGDLESYESAKSIFFSHLEDQIEAALGS